VVFWVVTQCNVVVVDHCFRGPAAYIFRVKCMCQEVDLDVRAGSGKVRDTGEPIERWVKLADRTATG
jgi:hypothetical protein